VRVSADRVLYLARVIGKKLKENHNLSQRADDETIRRAIVRVLTDAYKELDEIEQDVEKQLSKRKNISPKDQEFLFSRNFEEALRKHGA